MSDILGMDKEVEKKKGMVHYFQKKKLSVAFSDHIVIFFSGRVVIFQNKKLSVAFSGHIVSYRYENYELC